MLETLDLITQAFGEDYSIDILFLDFAKAFDSVSHVKLLTKLFELGFGSFILNWCKAFLSNRTQRVVIGENISGWKKVTSGVPQGSVLGPLLFVIFINDLSKKIIKDTKLYADDTKVISINRSQDDIKLLQEDINTLVKWSEEWLIKFNESKCKVMYFGTQNPNHEYMMNNSLLSETTIEKDLGIYISNNLEWDHHINTALGIANKK